MADCQEAGSLSRNRGVRVRSQCQPHPRQAAGRPAEPIVRGNLRADCGRRRAQPVRVTGRRSPSHDRGPPLQWRCRRLRSGATRDGRQSRTAHGGLLVAARINRYRRLETRQFLGTAPRRTSYAASAGAVSPGLSQLICSARTETPI